MAEAKTAPDVFCTDIINDGIFYKSKHMKAIVDIAPVVPGHSLIIPNRHVADITELTMEELEDFFQTLKKIKPVILKLYGDSSGSYNMTTQIGEYSGMSVRHVHVHIIPRTKIDPFHGAQSVYDAIEKSRKLSPEEYKKRTALLRKELKWSE